MRIKVLKLAVLYLVAMGLAAAVSQPAPAQPAASGWGLEPGQPVEVCKPEGQRAWLQRLQCADGSILSWRRIGNVGPRNPLPEGISVEQVSALIATGHAELEGQPMADGAIDHHAIDHYQLDCGGSLHALYMDMYHCVAPPSQQAPAGFVLGP